MVGGLSLPREDISAAQSTDDASLRAGAATCGPLMLRLGCRRCGRGSGRALWPPTCSRELVCLTDPGWQAIRTGRQIIEQIEADWSQRLGEQRFQDLCQALQALIDELDPRVTQNYVHPPR